MPKKRADGEGSIRKRADGRWEGRYTDTRETDPNKRVKSVTGKTQKIVVDKLKAALAEVSDGVPLLCNDNPTVAEWLDIWMNEYAINNLRDGTFETYNLNIRTYINPVLGNVKMKEVTGLHIQRLYNQAQATKDKGGFGLKASSVVKIRNILSVAFKQAVSNRIIRVNPLAETKPPKVEDTDIQILTKEEQKQFISVLPFFNSGNMFAVALATGMRIGELCALDLSDIDRERKLIDITKSAARRKDKHTGVVAIKVGATKTKYSIRKIPLLPSVEVMIDRQIQLISDMKDKAGSEWKENTLLFPTDEGNIHDLSGLRSSMGRILKRAGLPHMTIHALRHTYATTALNSGVAAQNVARLLGHKDGATTLKFYAHYINSETMTQLKTLEEQNVSHLGITAGELERIVVGVTDTLEKTSISEKIDDAILRAKNFPPKKSVEMVLSVCEDILCQHMENLSTSEKEMFLGVLARYTMMKRQYAEQEKKAKSKDKQER